MRLCCFLLVTGLALLLGPTVSMSQLGGTAPAPAAPAKASAGAGARWEYKVQTREAITELGKNDFAAGLNKLGDEGWELVAVTGVVAAGFDRAAPRAPEYYLKRRKGSSAREESAAAPADDAQVRLVRLKHAEARALAAMLEEVFAGSGGMPTLVADPRTNLLIIRGSPKEVAQVEELADRLDIPGPEKS